MDIGNSFGSLYGEQLLAHLSNTPVVEAPVFRSSRSLYLNSWFFSGVYGQDMYNAVTSRGKAGDFKVSPSVPIIFVIWVYTLVISLKCLQTRHLFVAYCLYARLLFFD